jgi:hypothetical protein
MRIAHNSPSAAATLPATRRALRLLGVALVTLLFVAALPSPDADAVKIRIRATGREYEGIIDNEDRDSVWFRLEYQTTAKKYPRKDIEIDLSHLTKTEQFWRKAELLDPDRPRAYLEVARWCAENKYGYNGKRDDADRCAALAMHLESSLTADAMEIRAEFVTDLDLRFEMLRFALASLSLDAKPQRRVDLRRAVSDAKKARDDEREKQHTAALQFFTAVAGDDVADANDTLRDMENNRYFTYVVGKLKLPSPRAVVASDRRAYAWFDEAVRNAERCDKCSDTAKVSCTNCDGKGHTACGACRGTGLIRRLNNRTNQYDDIACSACSGGKLNCSTCKGTQTVECRDSRCVVRMRYRANYASALYTLRPNLNDAIAELKRGEGGQFLIVDGSDLAGFPYRLPERVLKIRDPEKSVFAERDWAVPSRRSGR